MHDILKERVWRRIQALPQEQVYQVLDYIEFLEAKYAREKAREPDVLQKFAERVEDSLRMRSVAPKVISGTVGLLGSARRVMRTVSDASRDILGTPPPPAGSRPPTADSRPTTPADSRPTPADSRPTTPADSRPTTPYTSPAGAAAQTPVSRPRPEGPPPVSGDGVPPAHPNQENHGTP